MGEVAQTGRPGEAEKITAGVATGFIAAASNYPPFDREITEEPQQSLPNIEARYRAFIEEISAVVFTVSIDGRVGEAYVSPRLKAALSFSPDEWLNDPARWYQRIHPDDKQRLSLEAGALARSGRPLRSVYRVLAHEGQVIWLHCEAKMFHAGDGRPRFVHGIAFDITELKRAEESLQTARDELETRVKERTLELARANAKLRLEIAGRERIQDGLLEAQRELETRVRERTVDLAHASQILQSEMMERGRLEKASLDSCDREAAACALYFVEQGLNEVRAGHTKIWETFTVPKDAIGCGFTEAVRGVLSHHMVIRDRKIANYHPYPPTPWNASPRDRYGTPGPYEDAVQDSPIFEENGPGDKFKGIDVMRTVRSFDPCLPCGVHMYLGNGKVLEKRHSPTMLNKVE